MSTEPRSDRVRSALAVGSTFGAYDIRALLGAGGMGQVYRAFDPRLGREVALKVIRRVEGDDDSSLDRLLREATLASALNHPNIVTIYETGVVDSDRYIAMELVDGATLRQLAAQGLPLSRIVGIARQAAEALAVAHAAQIVHRDIKPDNVMVRPDGYVKLLDFGLARVQPNPFADPTRQPSTGARSEAGLILGTVGYMAPEQARGEAVTAEADIFALGVVLYELVTGRHPFMAASQLGTLHALLWETPEPPSLLNPELPRAIDQLIVEALQKDQRLRPGASEVMYRLALAHDSSVATALSSVTVTPRPAAANANLVGREHELDAMSHEFDRAQRGKARLVVVSGEAGVGKTTLIEAFVQQLEDKGEPVRVGRGRCSERLAGSEAYLPVLEALDSLQRNEHLGSLSRLIRALAPSWYAQLMPPTENDSSAARLAAETSGGSQERLKREIASLLEEVGRIQPVILWFDDVHWADPSTTDLIGYLARRLDNSRLLIVATGRPSEFAQLRHPFLPLKLDLVSRGLCREITPSVLDEAAIERYIALQFPEHAFPAGLARLIHQRTEGNPLFMAEAVRDLRRRQVVQQKDGRWVMTDESVVGCAGAARVGPKPDPAEARRARRHGAPPAERGQRPGDGLRLRDPRGRAAARRRGCRNAARAAGARVRPRPVRPRAGDAEPRPDAALPVRSSHVSERLLRVAARDAQGGVEPGDRRAAGAALRRPALRLPRGDRDAVRGRARQHLRRRVPGTARRRRPRGCTRTTNRRGSPSAGSI